MMGTGKNMVRERDTRVSLACSVLSCAHYSQAPATQAVREFVQTSRLFIFGVCFILMTCLFDLAVLLLGEIRC